MAAVACSSSETESTVDQLANGQALSFNLSLPTSEGNALSRVPATGTAGDAKQALTITKLEYKLAATTGGTENKWVTIDLEASKDNSDSSIDKKTITLLGVTKPTNLQVRINHTKEETKNTYSSVVDFQVGESEDVPAYGATEAFTFNNGIVVANGKNYEKISATVKVNIPVARIELSNFYVTNNKTYETLNLEKIFVNNVLTTLTEAGTSATSFKYATERNTVTDSNYAILVDSVDKSILSPITETYAYSIFPTNDAEDFAKVTLQFNNAKLKSENAGFDAKAPRYAVITKMGGITKFEAGKIYRIKKMHLTDENVGVDINGNNMQAVEVTVDVQSWDIIDVNEITWN